MKVGRKTWIPTKKILKHIGDLAAKGVTEASIARSCGINPATLSAKKKKFPELDETMKRARANSESIVTGFLWKMIMDEDHPKHFSSVLFYLKCQCGWKDRPDYINVSDLISKVSYERDTPPVKSNNDDS